MATVEVPQTLEYRGGQLNAAPILEVKVFTNWKKRFMWHSIAKSTWDDMILYHEGPSNVKESRVIDLKLCYNTFKFKEGESLTQNFTRYKALMNELVNDGIKLSKLEINTGFINGLPKKWLIFCQSLKNINHVKDHELASLFGKLKYEENLIENIYDTKKNKSLVSATPLSTAFFSTSIHKPELRPTKDFEAKYNKVKAKLTLLSSSDSTSKASMVKNKCLIAKAYEWDEEEVSSDDNEMVEVKVLMALAEDLNEKADDTKVSIPGVERPWLSKAEGFILPNHNTGLIAKAYEWDEEEVSSDDNEMVEVKVLMALAEDLNEKDLVHELNACKEQLLVLKQAKLDFLTMQHVNTEILKENKNLRTELKELTAITETWLNSSNKVNQCISEQIPSQKKRILGVDQLTEDLSNSMQKDLVFVKSLADDTKVSILVLKDPVVVTNSSMTDYDSTDESSVYNTRLPPLKKLDGAEPISGPKTIKSILRSKPTFKAETLKGVIINEPSSALAKDNKSSSASKVNSAPVGKLKSVKIENDPPLVIVIKELNNLKLQFSKSQSSYSRNNQPLQFPVNYPPQETSKEILQAQEDLMEAIQAFLKEYDHIPPNEKCMALLLAEEIFLKIKQTMEEDQNQPKVMQELLLKLMNDLQILKGIQQENKETAAQSFSPNWNFSMIDDEEARENFLKDICTFLRKFSRIPFGVTPKNRPTFYDNDDDEYTIIYSKPKAITPDLPIEEPDNSLSMGDERLDTIPSVENLVPMPNEFKGISEDTCDVPVCEDPSTFDALNDHSEILSDSNDDDTSSDDNDFEDIEYVSLEEVNDEKEFDLEDIFKIQDVIIREKLLNINRLITNIEALSDNPNPDCVLKSPFSFPILVTDSDSFFEKSDTSFSYSDNSLPEFEPFSDHTEETRSGSTTTHANNSIPEYDSFLFEIKPDQGRLIRIVISDNSNDPLLELPEFESFHFDLYDDPSFHHTPPEPSDVEISLTIETNAPVINNFDELNEDECFDPGGGEINVEVDNSFTFVTWTFLPYLTYPEVYPLLSSTGSEDTIFDPGIST
ncbi:hypothetical protein Tco_1343907 [Tanacetum coccineum]